MVGGGYGVIFGPYRRDRLSCNKPTVARMPGEILWLDSPFITNDYDSHRENRYEIVV